MNRKPKYFFTVFGDAHVSTYPVEGGVYGHDPNYINSSGIKEGDILLLYCCGTYPGHYQEVPGIGVVIGFETNGIKYQYFPICHPLSWDILQATIPDFQEMGKINWSLKGNWLREISSSSFRAIIAGRQIDWP